MTGRLTPGTGPAVDRKWMCPVDDTETRVSAVQPKCGRHDILMVEDDRS